MKTLHHLFMQKICWQFAMLSVLLLSGKSLFGQFTAGQEFFIQAKHSGLYLEVPNRSMENGTVLVQNPKNDQKNQIFRLQDAGEGYFYLVAKHSGKAIDVSGVSRENGALIHQWEIWGNDNQKFKLQDIGGGYVNIVAKHSGKAIDVSEVSASPGANIHQWEIWGGDNQKFRFIPFREKVIPSREKMAQVVVFNQGGYNARFTLEIQAPGKGFLPSVDQSRMLLAGQSQSFFIPVDRTVTVKAEYWDGLKYHFIKEIKGVTFTDEHDKKTFKTYGAMWDAQFVSEGPVSTSTPTRKLTLLCNGAFVGKFEISYKDGSRRRGFETGDLTVGQSKSYWIPVNTQVTVKGEFNSFGWHNAHNDGLQTINLNKDMTVGLEGTIFSASMVQY
jgi:hypothetical protein